MGVISPQLDMMKNPAITPVKRMLPLNNTGELVVLSGVLGVIPEGSTPRIIPDFALSATRKCGLTFVLRL